MNSSFWKTVFFLFWIVVLDKSITHSNVIFTPWTMATVPQVSERQSHVLESHLCKRCPNTSAGSHPGGILVRRLNHHSWLTVGTAESRHPSETALFIHSDLILWSQIAWGHMQGHEHRSTNKMTGSRSCLFLSVTTHQYNNTTDAALLWFWNMASDLKGMALIFFPWMG